MFQATRNSENGERYIYNILQVAKERKTLLFLVDFGGDLLWMDSGLFIPYIITEKIMPTFTIKETNRTQVFYAAIKKPHGEMGYDLIYYDGVWRTISDDECTIEGCRKLV